MDKAKKYAQLKGAIKRGEVTSVNDMYEFVVKTTLIKDTKINPESWANRNADNGLYRIKEIFNLASSIAGKEDDEEMEDLVLKIIVAHYRKQRDAVKGKKKTIPKVRAAQKTTPERPT